MEMKRSNNPRLLEINARIWIKRFVKDCTLASVPEEEITKWKELGIDMIWLMGVWDNKNL